MQSRITTTLYVTFAYFWEVLSANLRVNPASSQDEGLLMSSKTVIPEGWQTTPPKSQYAMSL